MPSGSLTVLITPQANYVVNPDKTVVSQVQPASRYVDSATTSISASHALNADNAISASYAEVSATSSYADNFVVSGSLTASAFAGDGSGLTGVTAQGTGVTVLDDGLTQGVAQLLDFTDGIDASFVSSTASISLNRTGSIEAGFVQFDTTFAGTGSHQTGRLYWDDDNKTATMDMFGTDVKLQIGQEGYIRARNNSGTTIENGDAVRIVGASGQRINIDKAISFTGFLNDNLGEVIGVATEQILDNQEGYITVYGTVRDIDTSQFTEGDAVYVSHTVSGSLVGTAPPAPFHEIQVGIVEVSHPSVGQLYVRPKRSLHFDEIVSVTGSNVPVGKSYLEYDSVTGITSFIDSVTSSSVAQTASSVAHLQQIVAVTGSINVTGSGIITEDMILRKEDQQVLFRSVITKNVYAETRQIEPTIPTGSYSGCQVEYHATKASATRQGVILGTWLNGQINYTDVSNLGIGDSDDLSFNMIIASDQAIIRAVSTGTDSQPWQIHTFLKTFSNIV